MRVLITSDTHRGYSVKTDAIFRHKFLPLFVTEEPDCILHAGDWGMTRPENAISGFKLFREFFPDTPIVGVLGNHDYWGRGDKYKPRPRSVRENEDLVREGAEEHKIQLLDGEAITIGEGVVIYGFDGWYDLPNPPTNDHHWLPNWAEDVEYLKKKADVAFNNIVEMTEKADICITHFPPYSFDLLYSGFCAKFDWMGPITANFRNLVVGHSHQDEDFMHGGCRVINPGSDYDRPKYKIVDLEEGAKSEALVTCPNL